MRRSVIATVLVPAVLCVLVGVPARTACAQEPDLKLFDWLAGAWEMTQGGRVTEEHWTAPTANGMIGMSRTVSAGRTTEFEFLRLEKRDHDLFYVPQPNGRPPVAFKLTSSTG